MQASWRAATGAQHAARPFNDKRDHRRYGTCGCLLVLPAGALQWAARDGAVGGKSLGSRAHMASASTATPPRTRDETLDGTLAFNPTHTHAHEKNPGSKAHARTPKNSRLKSALYTCAVLFDISQLLNTGLDRETLTVLVGLTESGVNPEALAAVVKELRRESAALESSSATAAAPARATAAAEAAAFVPPRS